MKLTLILSCLTLIACSSSITKDRSNSIVKTETRKRITPEGKEVLESISHFSQAGQLIRYDDFMDGKVYRIRKYEYGTSGKKTSGKFKACEDCEEGLATYKYQDSTLIEHVMEWQSSHYHYNEQGLCTLEVTYDNRTNLLYRFKTYQYDGKREVEKLSYKMRDVKLNINHFNKDSLIDSGIEPYHSIRTEYDENGRVAKSYWGGAVSDWFAVHEPVYDTDGKVVSINYSSVDGESGGSSISSFTYW